MNGGNRASDLTRLGQAELTGPEDREASLRFVLGQGVVDAMTIGTTAPGQFDDNVEAMARLLAA